MIEIDGSIGGGQLLRTAVGLSALTQKPIKIFNIRKGKRGSKPGLRPQHLTAVKTIGEFCKADIKGLKEGSLEIEFIPKKLRVTDKKIDIGTAGSISLLLQALTPILIFNKKSVALEVIGGTETKWAPTIQYIKYVNYPLINKIGAKLDLRIMEHGYYPKGGGRVIVESKPIKKLNSFICLDRGDIQNIHIRSVCSNLPPHVAERQGRSVLRTIRYYSSDIKTSMSYKSVKSLSSGSSITCYSICENSILGGSALGERGVRAEKIGEMAAEELLLSLKSKAVLDKYMADQILVYLALADGESHIKVEKITDHCKTNIQVIEQILPIMFNIDEQKKEISVKGLGFRP
jgi:RNA 3'-terminal phosphate cyclase (ATP)